MNIKTCFSNFCVCVQLLRNEIFAQDQVPLLLEMDSDSTALEKAVESGDPKLSMFFIKYNIILKFNFLNSSPGVAPTEVETDNRKVLPDASFSTSCSSSLLQGINTYLLIVDCYLFCFDTRVSYIFFRC